MNASAPIGIFDSGLGGLTVLEEVRKLLPHESLTYVADSAHAPYGSKPDVFIVERSLSLADFLVNEQHAKALVVACNTATAAAIKVLRERFDIPVIGMEPGLKPAVEATQSGTIGILATENTLKSEKFSTLLDAHGHRARILTQPCHGLVEAIEAGQASAPDTRAQLSQYLQPLLDAGADAIVLGCTHYPVLTPIIRELAGPDVHIIETGAAVARQLQRKLQEAKLAAETGESDIRFWTSGDPQRVATLASSLLGQTCDFQRFPEA